MRFGIFLFLFFSFSINAIAQTDEELGGAYLKRAENSYNNGEIDESVTYFKKAVKLFGDTRNSRISRLGMILSFEQEDYFIARSYSYDYFELAEKGTEDYNEMLDLRVDIDLNIDLEIAEMKRIEKETLIKEAQERKLDSLKKVWQTSSLDYNIEVDSISKFNVNNIAIYKKDNAFGIMDDVGNILEEASLYKHAISYDNFILLLSNKDKPTKIYYYNTNTGDNGLLPSVVSFNSSSTHYGKVMLPRANGLIVAYPNNSTKVYLYNLITKEFVTIQNQKDVLKNLRKNDIIDNYNKVGQVKLDKKWLFIGGDIGGGIFALYEGKNRLYGFLNTYDGNIYANEYYNYLGAYDGNFELIDSENRFWMTSEGTRQDYNNDKNGTYNGLTKVVKLKDGSYRFHQNIDGQDYLVLRKQKLINQNAFIAKRP
ncbi:hypothetical protein RM697_11780 [Ichthyenterobacterium sp. W332]|uniref:Tetratricopeptide repeat protein n=1 Tax=Microcosmobacter mediterraneus TaxID=3075607 RepID=A0ABU2YNG1_9FLAO|nr:hypothetical protein [Ichthyenterobacterium sp. W332]MDT0559335.1 hypothetical protein [Ichthyenterobacterium sp. W332]